MSSLDPEVPVVITIRLTENGEVDELLSLRHPRDPNPYSIGLLDTPSNREIAATRTDNVPLLSPAELVHAAVEHWEMECPGMRPFDKGELERPVSLAEVGGSPHSALDLLTELRPRYCAIDPQPSSRP
ncbi:hypothetical protein [Nocardioides ochotonae]|uniref:hypothetical protein n=1 Tax=Nocardioides ochotonae TaxID=2685869 RepID=UPI00140C9CD0|nr:hypothetical protein [Nocardioides ochotonae]